MSTNENRISPDDPRLTAFALGELEGAELAQMEADLRADPAAQAIVAQIRIAADQFQAALAGETLESAEIGESRVQPPSRERRPNLRRFLLWGIPLAACLALLLAHGNRQRPAHEPDRVVALSRPFAETAVKVPSPAAIFERAKATGAPAGSRNPVGGVQPGPGDKATDQSRVEFPAAPAQGQPVGLSPFEVNTAQAQGYFAPNTTTGTRLANDIGDIPSSVTVVDKQQFESTNAQNINGTTPPLARREIQFRGPIAGAGGRGIQGIPGAGSTSTGSHGRAEVKDLGNIAVAIPSLGAVPEKNSLMFGSMGGSAHSNGQPSAGPGLSVGLSESQTSGDVAWILRQIDRGVSFGRLTAFPGDSSPPGFSDAKSN